MQMRWLRAEGPRLPWQRWERVLEWDRTCALLVHRSLATPFEKLWVAVDRLGDWAVWVALIIAIALAGGPGGARCALHMFIAGTFALGIYKLVKRFACRERPCVGVAGVRRCVEPRDEFSFPSGHTLHAVVFSVIAMSYFHALAIPLLPFVALIAVSRIALGLHYPSDVLAGAVLGGVIALVSFLFV